MYSTVEVPTPTPDELDLVQLMLAEHGPSGVMTVVVIAFLWKVLWPVLTRIGANAQTLFEQHLAQGKEANERLAKLETAVTRSDEHNRAAMDNLRRSMETSLNATAETVKQHDAAISELKMHRVEVDQRLRGIEFQTGRFPTRPHPAAPTAD